MEAMGARGTWWIAGLAWWSAIAYGSVLDVDGVGYPTVSSALLVAADGDVIRVHVPYDRALEPGTDLSIPPDRELTLEGVGGSPVLPRLQVTESTLTLRDVTLRGLPSAPNGGMPDHGLHAVESQLLLERVVLQARAAGHGLFARDSDVELVEVSAADFPEDAVAVRLEDCTTTLAGGRLERNRGGAVQVGGGSLDVSGDAVFEDNQAFEGADLQVAGSARGPASLTVTDASFVRSSAQVDGGALFAWDADVALTRVVFTDTMAGGDGGAAYVAGTAARPAVVWLDHAGFLRTSAGGSGGGLSVRLADAVLTSVTIDEAQAGTGAGAGGGVHAVGSKLRLTGGALSDCSAYQGGGVFAAELREASTNALLGASELEITDSAFVGASSTAPPTIGGGVAAMGGTDLLLQRTSFRDMVATEFGGAVAVHEGASALLEDVDVTTASARQGGAYSVRNADVAVRRGSVAGGSADEGGGGYALGSGVVVEDGTWLSGTATGTGGTFWFVQGASALEVVNSFVCTSESGGSALEVRGSRADPAVLAFSALLGHRTAVRLADAPAGTSPSFQVLNNTLVDNAVLHLELLSDRVEIVNNAFVGGRAVSTPLAAMDRLVAGHNLYFETEPWIGEEPLLPTESALVDTDPEFRSHVANSCGSDLFPEPGSPMVGAGSADHPGPDGEPLDIGAFQSRDLDDFDGDGYLASEDDCDDTDPDSHPGAFEVPYDGIDQDCDGSDPCDFDGDGFDHPACGGTDCRDDDASVYPGASDRLDNERDEDCNGTAARSWFGGGRRCSCASGAAGPVPGLWLALVVLSLRRRGPRSR